MTETAGCIRTEVVWGGEAPAEPGARNRHSVRLHRRLALPKTPPNLPRTRGDRSSRFFFTGPGIEARIVVMINEQPQQVGQKGGFMVHSWVTVAMTTATLHFMAGSAWAQKSARLPGEDEGGFLQWSVAVGLMVVIMAAAFINPKRSHLT